MKKYLIIVLMLLMALYATAQDNLTLGITQDVRLAVKKDNAGNTPFTTDIIINWDWEMKQFDAFYPSVKLQYEWADLHGGTFQKYTISGGLTCNDVKAFGFDYPNLEIGLFAGVGVLSRPSIDMVPSMGVYSVILEASYELFNGFRGVLKYELNNTPDLNFLYNDNGVRHNVSAGIEISLLKK